MVLAQKQTYRQAEKNKDPNLSTCPQNHLIFDNEAKSISWRKVIIFNKWHSNPCP